MAISTMRSTSYGLLVAAAAALLAGAPHIAGSQDTGALTALAARAP
jgi:hypothetical protein